MRILRLNLGCGTDIRTGPGWVNVDFRELPGVDLVHDLSNPLPFEDGVADGIVAQDLLEHFPANKTHELLKDWFRVLKKGGLLELRVPDMYEIAYQIVNRGRWPFKDSELMELIYGSQDFNGNQHKHGFTNQMLRDALFVAGFSQITKIWSSDSQHNLNCVVIK